MVATNKLPGFQAAHQTFSIHVSYLLVIFPCSSHSIYLRSRISCEQPNAKRKGLSSLSPTRNRTIHKSLFRPYRAKTYLDLEHPLSNFARFSQPFSHAILIDKPPPPRVADNVARTCLTAQCVPPGFAILWVLTAENNSLISGR